MGYVGYVGQNIFYVGHDFYVGCVGQNFLRGRICFTWVKIFCLSQNFLLVSKFFVWVTLCVCVCGWGGGGSEGEVWQGCGIGGGWVQKIDTFISSFT